MKLLNEVSPEVFSAFDNERRKKDIKDIRITTVVASVTFMLFNVLDRLEFPDYANLFLVIRLSVVLLNLILVLLTLSPNAQQYSHLIKMAFYLIYSSSITVMTQFTGGYLSPYYAGINIVLIGFMVLIPLDVIRTSFLCIIIYLGYLIPIFTTQTIKQFEIFLNNNFFILSTVVLAISNAYVANKINLKEFAARYNLAKANDNLKNLNEMKTQFFANVSHEIRTPLTSIIAPLQSLRQGDVGNLNIDQNDLLDQIHRNAIRLLDLINQMLDFAKLEAGKARLRLSLVDIVDYTESLVSLFREVAIRKKLNLFFEDSGFSDRHIYIDCNRYERIITNLIRNAIKFTDSGSITVNLSNHDGNITLSITDTGIGIPKDHLPHIFKRFEQVDGTPTPTQSFGGTGLGLAIVEESVKLLQGKIKVDSVPGMGTTFTVTIPANLAERTPHALIERRKPNHENIKIGERRNIDHLKIPISDLAQVESDSYSVHAPENRPAGVELSGIKVLLSEDTVDLRMYIAKILSNLGHDVISVSNGLAAWEMLNERDDIDILVSDIMMLRMDGYELLEKVRGSNNLKDLPVILITAKSGEDPKLKALGIGADDYLPKPINVRELDARIRNILSTKELRHVAAEARVMNQRIEELMTSFAQSLEIRDAETGNHSRDVLEIGTRIAAELGVEIDTTLKASLLLHDIGKIGIPDKILLKPDNLNEEEMTIMMQHPAIGKALLENFPNFKGVSDIILAHQERYDGKGYPGNLSGTEIPLISRIIAVADAYHAMTNTRRYRKALSREKAIEELLRNRGTQFDPEVVDAFIATLNK